MLEILRCIFVPNLSKISMLMLPWKHIFELALMRNQLIQLSNDVTVTLFLNQSSQNFELCLEMIISTSVQNFSEYNASYFHGNTFFEGYFWQIGYSKSVMTSLWRHVSINLKKILYFCLLYQEASLCKIWAKSDKKQRSCKKWKWRYCDVISKNSSAIFCVWVFFTHTYWCTKFQVDLRSDKGITGVGRTGLKCRKP